MDKLPEYIGHYKILDKLGEGGFATVYLARFKDQDDAQPVALKALNSREDYGRFQREVETVARLDHPNIIHIYDTGEDKETKTPFFSMEYIPSGSLRDRLATEYRLPRNEAVELIKQVGMTLAYPHQQGIIHRDVNPKNILLDTRQKPTRPVLTDFGLVKPLAPQDSKLTKTIALIGTFAYYAPEQWNQEEVTPATDVYALAITFFEMISGQRPFKGDVFSLREKHLHEPLPLLSSVVSEVGSFFDEVLLKATAKNPTDRYQTVVGFIEALDAANQKAEQAAKLARHERAVETIQVAQDRWQQNNTSTDEILAIIDTALEDYPRYSQALRLRGKIWLKRQQFTSALADFEQAYKQEQSPTSETGLDYLNALKQAAEFYWQHQAFDKAVAQGRTIKLILDEDHNNGDSLQVWREAWTDLVQAHYDAGVEAFATRDPEDITQTIQILDREIEALEALDAHSQARAFKDKLTTLQIGFSYETGIQAFAAGNPDDIDEAIETLEREIEILENLEAYSESQDLLEKLRVLQIHVHYSTATQAYTANDQSPTETIDILERQIEALEALEAFDESQDLQDKLQALRAQDHLNSGIEAFADGNPEDIEKATAIMEREIRALQALNAGRECQELYSRLSVLHIKQHYNTGVEAFATSDLDNISQVIVILERQIKALETLEAHSESQDLQDKLRALQVKDHYNTGILAYADGTPENISEAIKVLEDEIEALQALNAEREWQGLREKLKLLQVKKERSRKYNEIQDLVAHGNYPEALSRLDKDFLRTGDYEYRDVARLLWGLAYAKQHEGQFPPEWEGDSPRHKKLERQHTINKFTIPVSLLIAIILGGIIAPQIVHLPGLTILLVISLALLIFYFAYYVWTYYINL